MKKLCGVADIAELKETGFPLGCDSIAHLHAELEQEIAFLEKENHSMVNEINKGDSSDHLDE